jgi:hypothetical protein
MFIPRHVYDALTERATKAEAVESHLKHENASLNAHIGWMQVRLTELSMERAMMLKRYLNIDVPVPSFEPAEKPADFNATVGFDDMGDEEAARLGISWNPDGSVTYAKA